MAFDESRWSNLPSVKPIISGTGKVKEISVIFTQYTHPTSAPQGTSGVF